jgi:mRNA interferase RelE/StbE
MKVEFLEKFYDDLENINSQPVRDSLKDVIRHVISATKPQEIKHIKKLRGQKNAYRIRMGDYRIGVYIEKSIVEFARIVHRKDIYKVFP